MNAIARLLVVGCAVASLALAGCSNPAAPQGNYGIITGTVMSSSGQPIAGAVVTADLVDSSQPTGADGKYTIQSVPIDSSSTSTSVTCTAQGYQDPPAQNVTVTAGKSIVVNFTMTPS
jgi:hypothetical protein